MMVVGGCLDPLLHRISLSNKVLLTSGVEEGDTPQQEEPGLERPGLSSRPRPCCGQRGVPG